MRARSLVALLLALMLMAGPAQAVFSPQGQQLADGWQQGQPMMLTLGAQLDAWQELPADDLPAVSAWLNGLSLRLALAEDRWDMALLHGDREALRAAQTPLEQDTQLIMGPPATAFLGNPERDPLNLLLGHEPSADWAALAGLPDRLTGALPGLWALLAPHAVQADKRQTIHNVGTAASRVEHTLSAEQWNALWPQAAPALAQALGEGTAADVVRSLRFTTEGSLRRLLDGEGRDIGLRFEGGLSTVSMDERRVTLLMGYQPVQGLYLNLKAPQSSGRDTLEIAFTAALTGKAPQRNLTADWTVTRRLDGKGDTRQGILTLRSKDTPQGEALTGRVRMTHRPAGGKASRLTLEPDLVLADGRMEGSLRMKQETGGKTALDLTWHLSLAPGAMPEPPAPQRSFDLRDAADAQLPAARQALTAALLAATRGLLMDLPEPQRLLLIHLMGRDLRTQDMPAPHTPGHETNRYLVTDPLSTEEGTP